MLAIFSFRRVVDVTAWPCRVQRPERRSQGANRRKSYVAGPQAVPISTDAYRSRGRMEERRDAVRPERPEDRSPGNGAAASPHALYLAKRRRTGRGIEGAAG